MASAYPEKQVELGFVERRTPWKLRSKFFPSKIGGKPSWLNLKDIPSTAEVECPLCKKPCVFLLQVYAPYDTSDDSFHRSLFIFMCKDGKCCKENRNDSFIIFRNQLPRKNDFYSFDAPVENEKDSNTPSAEQILTLCSVCGCRGTLQCSGCKSRKYCGEQHQKMDWQSGHKSQCTQDNQENMKQPKKIKNSFLLPEYDLVMDSEDLPPEAPEKSEEEKMKDYYKFVKAANVSADADNSIDDLASIAKKNDKVFNKFQKRVNHEPEQVLRYDRHREPLWVSSENKPSEKDIPLCHCGAKRLFEFQIMPQLLNYLSLDSSQDSVDWGTLIAYTCAKSCSFSDSGYVKEFLWKQDYSENKD